MQKFLRIVVLVDVATSKLRGRQLPEPGCANQTKRAHLERNKLVVALRYFLAQVGMVSVVRFLPREVKPD